jgi:hypothetical protein
LLCAVSGDNPSPPWQGFSEREENIAIPGNSTEQTISEKSPSSRLVLWLAVKRWAGKAPWITFLAGTGAIVLTFLAGAELDPNIFRAKWKESTALGLVIHVWCVSTAAAPSRISGKSAIKEPYRIVKPMRDVSAFTSRWLSQRRSEPRPGVR